jgi:hypothetical protein
MIKLGKLTIKPEKVIKNEEMVNFKGGDMPCSVCYCYDEYGSLLGPAIYGAGGSVGCYDSCVDLYASSFYGHKCG